MIAYVCMYIYTYVGKRRLGSTGDAESTKRAKLSAGMF